jgi:predicted DNA-binding protein with PD1-like motif
MGDKPFIHAHITIADQQFGTFGGHLKEAIVGATCEIYLTRLRGKIQRIKDEITGLNLLDISCETDIRR